MIEVIDNFLSKTYHKEILEMMDSPHFDWYYNTNITHKESSSRLDEFGFSHIFWDENEGARMSPTTAFWKPALLQTSDAIDAEGIIRSRGDMTLYSGCETVVHDPHVDLHFPHIATVFYVNDSDGDTIFYSKRFDGTLEIRERVSPKANRLVFFGGDILHTGSSPINHKSRIIINSNFEI